MAAPDVGRWPCQVFLCAPAVSHGANRLHERSEEEKEKARFRLPSASAQYRLEESVDYIDQPDAGLNSENAPKG